MVFQITRNVISDHFRKGRNTENDIESLDVETDVSNEENMNREIADCLRVLIQRLPEDQQRALSLYELNVISLKEIAERESISVSAASSRVQRGRKSLEAMLNSCCEFQLDRIGNIVDYGATDPSCCVDQDAQGGLLVRYRRLSQSVSKAGTALGFLLQSRGVA